jgi:alginate O-acetyltransferase complex protein AlgI
MLTMLIGGLWHGANWTFVVWGGLHGFYLWVEKMVDDKTGRITALRSSLQKTFTGFLYALFTFFLVNITWVFFRANSFTKAWDIFRSMFGMHSGEPMLTTLSIIKVAVIIPAMFIVHWLMRNTKVLDVAYKIPWWLLGLVWAVMLLLLMWSQESSSSFIYFQF